MSEHSTLDAAQRLYDAQPQHEWERMERHRTEFAVTLRALHEHLPAPPAHVLDCGGGPGRYSIELAQRGYEVTLFDLSPECLRLAQSKAQEAGVRLAGIEQGTATDLARFSEGAFDAVLLMGPLYHLLQEHERLQALSQARRVLTPGGMLFASFLSRYAALRWAAANEPGHLLKEPQEAESMLTRGILPPRAEATGFFAYFAHPTEVRPLMARAGFEVITVLGVEGLVSMIEVGVNALSGDEWNAWVELNYRVADDPSLHGGVEHLLAIARKAVASDLKGPGDT
jgi:S-adenosylmethionine-dependent methyltransferase